MFENIICLVALRFIFSHNWLVVSQGLFNLDNVNIHLSSLGGGLGTNGVGLYACCAPTGAYYA